MPHLPDDRKLWCGNIPSRISVGELKAIMLEALCVDVTILAKGPICRPRQWAIVVFESASAAQAFRMQYDGQSIPELHVPGNRFQVAPVKQKIVRRPVLIPPIVNRPQRQHCISAAALLLPAASLPYEGPPEAIGCPRFRGTVLAASLPPGHPQSPARMQILSKRPKLDEPTLQEYLVPVANPVIELNTTAAVETKHERENNSPATELREAGIKTESEKEIDTEFEAEDAVAPEKTKYKYEPKTEVDEKPVSRKKKKKTKSDD